MGRFFPRWSHAVLVLSVVIALSPPVQAKGPSSASTTHADGTTEIITLRPDGTKTRTVTAPDGTVLDSGPMTPEPPTKVPPREHGTSGSTTDANGNTVTIKKNPDGTTTRTVTSPDGTVLDSGPVTAPPPTKVPPREHGTSGSTTDANGNTVTIKKNPDGSKTRTVMDPSGHVISSGPVTPPPPTKPAKRKKGTWASTTDADGNTVTISTQPDGTKVRTVTSPDGTVLKTEPLNPPPAGAQLLYDIVTKNDCTINTAMVLRMEGGKTLLDVSILGTGKGGSFRSWEPERMSLLFGKHKFKPVTTTPYFVEKESAMAGLAPILFAAIAMEDAAEARKAESSKGTPCPLTGKTEGGEKRKRGKLGRAIDEIGMTAGLSLLASQAKGQIQGMRATFDVTGHEHELQGAKIAARLTNTNQDRLNLSNEAHEVDATVPVNFTVQGDASATSR